MKELTVAEKCKELRKAFQMTQKAFGRFIGCSQSMIAIIECGYSGTKSAIVGKIEFLHRFCALA